MEVIAHAPAVKACGYRMLVRNGSSKSSHKFARDAALHGLVFGVRECEGEGCGWVFLDVSDHGAAWERAAITPRSSDFMSGTTSSAR